MANPVANMPRGFGIPVPNMRVPLQGAKALPFLADFTSSAALDGSFESAFESGDIDFIQSVYIDNSANPAPLVLVFPGTGQRGQNITAAPGSQGYYPCSPAEGAPQFTVSTVLGQQVPMIFYNVALPYFVWSAQSAPGGGVVIAGVYVDRSGAIALGGTSQVLAVSNIARKRIIIENPASAAGQNIAAAESLFINFTGVAGVNDGTSLELTPGGSYDSAAGPVSTQQITVNAATTNHRFIAKEM